MSHIYDIGTTAKCTRRENFSEGITLTDQSEGWGGVDLAERAFRQPIDMERLLWWAFDQVGYLPWRGINPRELMLDGGYSVVPKGVPRVFYGSSPLLRCDVADDAAIVIDAVRRLDPFTAALVRVNAKAKRRPDWFEGAEPKQIKKTISWRRAKRGRKKGHRSRTIFTWDIDPMAIRAARDIYQRWHEAVSRLANRLQDDLEHWTITGFRAPIAPWEASKK